MNKILYLFAMVILLSMNISCDFYKRKFSVNNKNKTHSSYIDSKINKEIQQSNHYLEEQPSHLKSTVSKEQIDIEKLKASDDLPDLQMTHNKIETPANQAILTNEKTPEEKRLEQRFKGAEPYWGKGGLNSPIKTPPIINIKTNDTK
jgi:hypothetical protein